jgi:hypothetical protein
MTKQFNIRSEKAHALATKHAEASGKSLAAIVEQALEDFDRKAELERAERSRRWHAAVKAIQDEIAKSDVKFDLDDMYDEDGLPV